MDIGADEIRSWHRAKGWVDIGYHYVITRHGVVELGRDLDGDGDVEDEMGAHAYGHNRGSLAICLVGGIDDNGNPQSNYTRLQWAALSDLVADIRYRHGLSKNQVKGHNELPNVQKSCPCFSVKDWI